MCFPDQASQEQVLDLVKQAKNIPSRESHRVVNPNDAAFRQSKYLISSPTRTSPQ
jgi:hypothetical protein